MRNYRQRKDTVWLNASEHKYAQEKQNGVITIRGDQYEYTKRKRYSTKFFEQHEYKLTKPKGAENANA